MKNKLTLSILLLTFIIGFGAFVWKYFGLSKEPTKEEVVKVAYGQYTSPIFLAYDKGIFEKYGVKVEMQLTPDTAAMMQGLSTGEVDVGTPPYSVLFDYEKANPGKFKIYGGIVETINNPSSYLIVKDKINSPKDLVGKKIVIRSGLNSKIQSGMILQGLDIDPDSVEFVQVQPSLTAQTFAKSEISASIDVEPSATAMLQKKLGKVLISGVRPTYIVNPYPTVAQVFSSKFVSERPKSAEAFRLALEEAVDQIRADDREFRAVSQKWLNLDPEVVNNMRMNVYQKYGELDRASVDSLIDIEVQHKVLDTEVDFRGVYYQLP